MPSRFPDRTYLGFRDGYLADESKKPDFILMMILGLLGWTGVARVVRGQILSLREQDFMVATEAQVSALDGGSLPILFQTLCPF